MALATESLFLNKCRGLQTKHIPIWVMRQAGRYLPEYRKVRREVKNFLDMCYNPDIASEVTLQPIDRFDRLDAAIIFSDILVVPDALGMEVTFQPGEGPRLQGIENVALNSEFHSTLLPVYDAISKVRQSLSNNKALIGFAGAPWTLFTYMVEGRGSKDFTKSRSLFYKDPLFVDDMFSLLQHAIVSHLEAQIESGCQVVKLFDSWASAVPGELYDRYVIEVHADIAKQMKARFPDIPIIAFPRGSGPLYTRYVEKVSCVDVIALDYQLPLSWIREVLAPLVKEKGKVLQGGMDPALLAYGSSDVLVGRVHDYVKLASDVPYIFNLGHGIIKDTPVEQVEIMLEALDA